MKKIIFLDIDGVLNYELFYKKEDGPHETRFDYDLANICGDKIKLLNTLIEETGADVVISSSWRKNKTLEELRTLFQHKGFKGNIIDKTPVLYYSDKEYGYSVPRGCEIKAWIGTNKDILSCKVSKLRYVIFDDDSDMLYWQRNNYIQTDRYCGLTPTNIFKARQILNF